VILAVLATVLEAMSSLPSEATRLACRLERREDLCPELLAILASESRGAAVGVHVGHARRVAGGVFWRKAVAAGLLRPEACAAHQSTDGGAGWGIRGPHGLAAAYSVHALGECVAPEAVDVPILSAVAAVRRLAVLERRYGLRTPAERARAWRLGVGAARR
jgi:hypothetical protein